MKRILATVFVAIVALTARSQTSCTCNSLGPELAINGDFNNGNTGFQTVYTFATYAWPDNYGIANSNTNPNPGSWMNCGDHTGGGNYMWADASSSNQNMPIWEEILTVQPNKNYVFSFWMCNVNGDSISCPPGKVQFSINGVALGSFLQAPNPSCVWIQNCVVWNSGNATSADISILNQNAYFSGNDFGFDDFSFRECITGCQISPQVSPSASICKNTSAQLTASGGTIYNWVPAAGLNNPNIANPIASPTVNTTYTVYVSNGQCGDSATVTVSISPEPHAVVSPGASICKGDKTTLIASGGSTYAWSPPQGLSSTTSATVTASPNVSTTYTVVAYSGSCTDTARVPINILPTPVLVSTDKRICKGQSVQLQVSGANSYSWTPSIGYNSPFISNPTVAPEATTVYTVEASNGQCTGSILVTVTVVQPPKAIIMFTTSDDENAAPMTVNYYNESVGATTSLFTMYSPTTNTYSSNFHYTYNEPGTYEVMLNVANADGCKDSTAVTIEVKPTSGVFVPNAFSPNGDGRNEIFKVVTYGINEFEAFIYDRWGSLVYKWTEMEGGWDGTYKGELVQEDVFVWEVKAKGIDGKHYNPRGQVSVLR